MYKLEELKKTDSKFVSLSFISEPKKVLQTTPRPLNRQRVVKQRGQAMEVAVGAREEKRPRILRRRRQTSISHPRRGDGFGPRRASRVDQKQQVGQRERAKIVVLKEVGVLGLNLFLIVEPNVQLL